MSINPFMPSTHGHPNFNPTKNAAAKKDSYDSTKSSSTYHYTSATITKQPKPPDKPMIPYMRYSKKVWDDVKAQYPDLKVWEISKIIGQMWRELNDDEKQIYIDEFELEKIEYNELLKQYHNSPAYQSWIATLKSKENEEREGMIMNNKKREKRSHNQMLMNNNNNNNNNNSPQRTTDGRFSLQSLDNLEDNDEYFSAKQLAAARYYRNNKLIHDIFTESIVPENRHVSDSKVQILRRQVESLTVYQKKMMDELEQIKERFEQKKNSLLESSKKFQDDMNKRFSPNELDQAIKDHYRRTLLKTMEMLKSEQQQRLNQQFPQKQMPLETLNNNVVRSENQQLQQNLISISEPSHLSNTMNDSSSMITNGGNQIKYSNNINN